MVDSSRSRRNPSWVLRVSRALESAKLATSLAVLFEGAVFVGNSGEIVPQFKRHCVSCFGQEGGRRYGVGYHRYD